MLQSVCCRVCVAEHMLQIMLCRVCVADYAMMSICRRVCVAEYALQSMSYSVLFVCCHLEKFVRSDYKFFKIPFITTAAFYSFCVKHRQVKNIY